MKYTKEYIKELEDKLAFYRAVLDHVDNGVVLFDKEGVIFEYNKAVSIFEQKKKEEMLGKRAGDVYQIKTSRIENVLKTQKSDLNALEPYQIKDGPLVDSLFRNYRPVFNPKGEFLGVSAVSCKPETMAVQLDAILEMKNKELHQNEEHRGEQAIDIIGESLEIKQAINECVRAAYSDADALIIGETGTGKELFVKNIHKLSARSQEPLVPINCATIPENLLESILFGTKKGAFTDARDTTGLFEAAGRGTLFLDELSSMNPTCQSKLLRVVQEKSIRKIGSNEEIPIHCRIIAAINEDPFQIIEENKLRKDLFYRLSTISLYIPPLRRRKGDVRCLTAYFIAENNRKYKKDVRGATDYLHSVLEEHDWPGNVRELKNLIESVFILFDENQENMLDVKHLPQYFLQRAGISLSAEDSPAAASFSAVNLQELLTNTEKEAIRNALFMTGGNKTLAAQALGVSKQKLHYRLRVLGMDEEEEEI